MKIKAAIALVLVLLIGAQLYFGHRRSVRQADTSGAQAVTDAGPVSRAATPGGGEFPVADDIVSIDIAPAKGEPVRLERTDAGWVVASYRSAPASTSHVEQILRDVRESVRNARPLTVDSAPEGDQPRIVTGLENGAGVRLVFTAGDGSSFALMVGMRPAGVFDETYALIGPGGPVILPADIRGDIGLWNNTPDDAAGHEMWLDTVVLTFDPADAVRVEASYPDHTLAFQRGEDGVWQPDGYTPTREFDAEGFLQWLADLSRYTVLDLAPVDEPTVENVPKAHRIAVTMADGSVKTVTTLRLDGSSDCITETSDRPGFAFRLSDWRFRNYFHPVNRIFPASAPRFSPDDIRFMDIRQGGESVKISLRDGEWRGVALPYRVRTENASRLARLLATLQPEDYAAPDFKAIRAGYGGPMVEVILSGGDVHQYRLAGRHPLFPWRYITVDGATILSITDEEASVMFPGFAELLDLGKVFPTFDMPRLDAVELSTPDGTLVLFQKMDDQSWTAESERGSVDLFRTEAEKLLGELLEWPVAGFFDPSRLPDNPELVYTVRLVDTNGTEKTVTFFPALDRDIPYLLESGRGFVIDRSAFFNWLSEIREIRKQIDIEAEQQEAERLEAERREAEQSVPDDTPDEADPDLPVPTDLAVPDEPALTEEAPVQENTDGMDDLEAETAMSEPLVDATAEPDFPIVPEEPDLVMPEDGQREDDHLFGESAPEETVTVPDNTAEAVVAPEDGAISEPEIGESLDASVVTDEEIMSDSAETADESVVLPVETETLKPEGDSQEDGIPDGDALPGTSEEHAE